MNPRSTARGLAHSLTAALVAFTLTAASGDAVAQTMWGSSTPSYGPVFPLPPGFQPRAQSYPLGPGMSAERTYACAGRLSAFPQCTPLGWRPVGFTFGARPDLVRALTFSGDGRGRVIASTERDVILSDDRGRTWQRADWNSVNRPQVIAMDPETRFGVAVAEGGIHVSDDGGSSWRFLRELPGRRVVQVVLAGRNAMLADGNGGLWALVQGSELQVLSESGNGSYLAGLPQFRVEGPMITASDVQGHVVRVDGNGAIDRAAPSTLWGR